MCAIGVITNKEKRRYGVHIRTPYRLYILIIIILSDKYYEYGNRAKKGILEYFRPTESSEKDREKAKD